jgi:hypothetical protein
MGSSGSSDSSMGSNVAEIVAENVTIVAENVTAAAVDLSTITRWPEDFMMEELPWTLLTQTP